MADVTYIPDGNSQMNSYLPWMLAGNNGFGGFGGGWGGYLKNGLFVKSLAFSSLDILI